MPNELKKNTFRRNPRSTIPTELLKKHSRGSGIKDITFIKNKVQQAKLVRNERAIQWAEKQAARAEILLTEQQGYLIPEDEETIECLTQKDIVKNVDITSATKYFQLELDFGPYRIDYTKNGRHLLIGGKKGHVAAFDWVTKRLHCEVNVMEEVVDVQWLHLETMFAVAQKNWVYIYDNQGVEIHCLKQLYRVLRMTFLPYHFLLATSNEDGWLNWFDTSIGKQISAMNTKQGRLSVMTQNPHNAVLCLGHPKGVVSMWSPNMNEPLAQMLCHNSGVQTIAIDQLGRYMMTTSANREMKVWDIRSLNGPIQNYHLKGSPTDSSLSQQGKLALAMSNMVLIYNNCHLTTATSPYLMHKINNWIGNIEFCPFEDVLGIGSRKGFTSILVPGAGEANFDAFEANPMQAKSQRKEAEVKALLEKIQPELICLDSAAIAEVNVPSLKERLELKTKILDLKPQKIDFVPRKRKRVNKAKADRVKKIIKENHKKAFIRDLKTARSMMLNDEFANIPPVKKKKYTKPSVLDRFKSKRPAQTPSFL